MESFATIRRACDRPPTIEATCPALPEIASSPRLAGGRRDGYERTDGMLTWLTKRLRVRTAAIVAAVYALCVVAPPVALAFTDGAVAAHCLTGNHHAPAKAHVHADGSVHNHSGGDDTQDKSGDKTAKGQAGSCCGLFCFAAMPADVGDVIAQPIPVAAPLPALQAGLSGRGPDRINRPPITL